MSKLPREENAAPRLHQVRLLQRPRSSGREGSKLTPANMPSVIALDAMGSDRAPKPEIEGAIHAARNYGVRVLLVGPETIIKAELDRHPSAARLPLEIVHASEVISMEDKVEAIRAKRDSSM